MNLGPVYLKTKIIKRNKLRLILILNLQHLLFCSIYCALHPPRTVSPNNIFADLSVKLRLLLKHDAESTVKEAQRRCPQ